MAKLEFENHKNQLFPCLLRPEHVKTNHFGNGMTKLTFKIGLSMFDFKQFLLDSHCQVKMGTLCNGTVSSSMPVS